MLGCLCPVVGQLVLSEGPTTRMVRAHGGALWQVALYPQVVGVPGGSMPGPVLGNPRAVLGHPVLSGAAYSRDARCPVGVPGWWDAPVVGMPGAEGARWWRCPVVRVPDDGISGAGWGCPVLRKPRAGRPVPGGGARCRDARRRGCGGPGARRGTYDGTGGSSCHRPRRSPRRDRTRCAARGAAARSGARRPVPPSAAGQGAPRGRAGGPG